MPLKHRKLVEANCKSKILISIITKTKWSVLTSQSRRTNPLSLWQLRTLQPFWSNCLMRLFVFFAAVFWFCACVSGTLWILQSQAESSTRGLCFWRHGGCMCLTTHSQSVPQYVWALFDWFFLLLFLLKCLQHSVDWESRHCLITPKVHCVKFAHLDACFAQYPKLTHENRSNVVFIDTSPL